MEKFGIFELLDTLSAIMESGSDAPAAEENRPPFAKDNAPPASPAATDSAFLPPDYALGESMRTFSDFLSRHDETVKRIEKKK